MPFTFQKTFLMLNNQKYDDDDDEEEENATTISLQINCVAMVSYHNILLEHEVTLKKHALVWIKWYKFRIFKINFSNKQSFVCVYFLPIRKCYKFIYSNSTITITAVLQPHTIYIDALYIYIYQVYHNLVSFDGFSVNKYMHKTLHQLCNI